MENFNIVVRYCSYLHQLPMSNRGNQENSNIYTSARKENIAIVDH